MATAVGAVASAAGINSTAIGNAATAEGDNATAIVVGKRQGGFKTEKRLVLHADLVDTFDHDRPGRIGITAVDPLMADDVAIGMDRGM